MEAIPFDSLAMQRLMGEMHFDAQCWALAMGYYNDILLKEPNNADALYGRGLCAMHLAQQSRACEDFALALSLNPAHKHAGKAYNFRGDYFRSVGDFSQAVECYTHALVAGTTIKHVFARGECLMELDQYAEAVTDLSTAILKEHALEQAYYLRGQCLFHLEAWKQAREDFDQDLRLNTQRAESFLMRGKCYMQERDFKSGLRDFNEAIRLMEESLDRDSIYLVAISQGSYADLLVGEVVELDEGVEALLTHPLLSFAYETRGQCFLFQNALDEALGDLNRAVKLDRTSASAIACRANCIMAKSAWELAASELRRAIELDPSAIQPCQWLGECLFELGQYEESIAWFSKVIENTADGELFIDANNYRAQAHIKLSRWEHALSDYDAATRAGAQLTALGHHQYGLSLYGMGIYDRVMDHLNLSLQLNEDVPLLAADTHTVRGRLHARQGNYRAAEDDFAEALRFLINTNDILRLSGVYEMRGEARYLEGLFEEALVDLNKASELDKGRPFVYYWRARCFSDLEQWAAAMENFKEGLRLSRSDKESAAFYTSRGYCLMLQKRRRRAIKDFDRAIDLDPGVPSPYRGRAVTKMAQKDWWGALADLNILLEMPGDTTGMPNLADVYAMRCRCNEELGNDEEADRDANEAERLGAELAEQGEDELQD